MKPAIPPAAMVHPVTPCYYLGVAFTVLAFFFVAVAGALIKILGHDIATSQVMFVQSVISFLLILPKALTDQSLRLSTQHIGLHIIRAIGGFGGFFLFFLSIHYTSLLDAVLLSNTSPLFIPLIAFIWVRVKILPHLWWGLMVGFIGIVFVLRPNPEAINWGEIFACLSGILLALGLFSVRRLTYTEPAFRILFYYFLISSILSLPIALVQWHSADTREWLILISAGICMALINLFLVLSYRYAKPSHVSAFNYSAIVFAAIIDWIMWGQVPTLLTLIGTLLVCTGAWITIYITTHEAS